MADRTPSRQLASDGGDWPVGSLGALRDALAVLRNLDQLLRSIKVGPKALAMVIPDVHASCSGLSTSTRTLLDALNGALPDALPATDALWRFMVPRVQRLEQELADAQGRPVNAKQRLSLQKSVVTLAGDLDSSRALIDLLGNAAWGARVYLNLVELVNQTAQSVEPGLQRLAPIAATVRAPHTPVELLVNTHASLALVAMAVSVVQNSRPRVRPHVLITADGDERRIQVTSEESSGQDLVVARRRIVEPTQICMAAAAQAMGARVQASEDGTQVSLIWCDARLTQE